MNLTHEPFNTIIISFATAFITWFFARKKNKANLRSLKTDNEIKSAKYYQSLLDDMSKRLEKAIKLAADMEAKYQEMIRVNTELVAKNEQLIAELRKFKQLNGKPKEKKQ